MYKPSDFNHWKYWLRYEWHEWNPYRLARKIAHFLSNIWAYRHILWDDRDCDYVYLLEMMELKLLRMAKHFESFNILVSSPRSARECRIAAGLCHRLLEDNYVIGDFTSDAMIKHRCQRQADLDYLTHLLKRKLFNWWD